MAALFQIRSLPLYPTELRARSCGIQSFDLIFRSPSLLGWDHWGQFRISHWTSPFQGHRVARVVLSSMFRC